MNRSFFFILGALLAVLALHTGCGKALKRLMPAQVSERLPAISKVSYDQLLSQNPEVLARKAAAKQLGNCVGIYQSNRSCNTQFSFVIRLANIDKDFLLYERPEPNATICAEDAGYYVTEALKTGVCYSVTDMKEDDIVALPTVTLARRAYYGTLKYCTSQKVNSAVCASGAETYGIYLSNTERYYPYMTTAPYPLGCFTDIGVQVKQAIVEGYCFKK